MYKEDLALNNFQWLICHKTQPNNEPTNRYLIKQADPKIFLFYKKISIDITSVFVF